MIRYTLKNYLNYIILLALFSGICAFLTLLLPDIFADIISNGIAKSNQQFIYQAGIKLIAISFFILATAIISSYISNKMGAKIGANLKKEMYHKTINLDEENINKFGISSLIVRNTNDINQIQTMISLFFKTITYTLILGIGGIIKAISKGKSIPYLSLIVILCILVVIIVLSLIFITVIPKYDKLQNILDNINNRFQEVLKGILVIKVFNQEKFEFLKTKKITDEHVDLEYFLNKIMSLLNPFITFILNFCTISIVYIIFNYALTITDLANMLAFSEYATQVISSFLSLAVCAIFLPKAFVSFNRVREVTNTYNKIYDIPKPKSISKINKITFKNVTFTYQNSNNPCLKNVNFEIKEGETLAIIGATASGKSTIINLLNRFYDVDDGGIYLNDIDIRQLKLMNINQKIATVFQNDFLFNETLKENLFQKNADNIKKILKISSLEDFGNNLNQSINFEGSNLSGGQKQRIAIARALLKNADVLILDDALSSIDYKTEKKIMDNIKIYNNNLIKIIITNRVASIKNADKIVVLDNGNIIEQGTHSHLINSCPLYQQMCNNQLAKEDNNG